MFGLGEKVMLTSLPVPGIRLRNYMQTRQCILQCTGRRRYAGYIRSPDSHGHELPLTLTHVL